jgi:hypothetical protein
MKLEPSILYQQHAFSVGLLKILVAAAIVLALLCLVATIREVRDRPSSAAGLARRRRDRGDRRRRHGLAHGRGNFSLPTQSGSLPPWNVFGGLCEGFRMPAA